jgi:hypothetical protein
MVAVRGLLELFDAFRLRVLAILLFVKMQFWDFMKITGVIWSLSPVSQRKGVFHGE